MPSRSDVVTPAPELRSIVNGLRRNASLLALAALGCHGERAEAVRAEAGRIAHAVHEVREAPSGQKRLFVKALGSQPCSDPDVCTTKKTCVEAYDLAARSEEALAAVRHAAEESPDPVPSSAVELLSRTESDLEKSRDLARTCADLEGALRRRYKL